MKGMKAYVLDLGYCLADGNFFEVNKTVGTIFDENPKTVWTNTPFYAILIKHPTVGWILYDTGAAPSEEWPDNLKAVCKVTNDGDRNIPDQLKKIGVKPEEVKHVIISHMHIDHIGGLRHFPNATVYVDRKEAEAALTTVYANNIVATRGFYYKPDVTLEHPQMVYLDQDTEDCELFPGVWVYNLRGHTAGVLGLVMELESGNILVTSDAANMRSNYEGVPGGIVFDSLGAGAAVAKLHRLAKKHDVKDVWFSHDEAQFKSMKKVPESY